MGQKKVKVEEVTKEQVLKILGEIVEQQDKMRVHMKSLTRELIAKDEPFEQTYKRVKEVQPDDPLERYGLSMMDFDQLLNKHQSDQQVREGITKIMSVGDDGMSTASDRGSAVPVKTVIEV